MSSLALAVVLSLVSAVAYAAGAIMQEHVAASTSARPYAPLHHAAWWVAVALNGLGAVLHVVALAYGPLSLVQPLGALTIVFALPMAALFVRRRAGAAAWRGAIMATAGLARAAGADRHGRIPLAGRRAARAAGRRDLRRGGAALPGRPDRAPADHPQRAAGRGGGCGLRYRLGVHQDRRGGLDMVRAARPVAEPAGDRGPGAAAVCCSPRPPTAARASRPRWPRSRSSTRWWRRRSASRCSARPSGTACRARCSRWPSASWRRAG